MLWKRYDRQVINTTIRESTSHPAGLKHTSIHTEILPRYSKHSDRYEEALEQLEAISLHDIGEMWPFYILAVHRVLEGGGYHDELEHRLEMFDSMPFPGLMVTGSLEVLFR